MSEANHETTLTEALDALSTFTSRYANCVLAEGDEPTEELNALAKRILSLTRWIPASERMPTEADGDKDGWVLVKDEKGHVATYRCSILQDLKDDFGTDISKHEWRRIDKPEAQP